VAGIIFVWYTLLGIVVLAGTKSHIAFDFVEKSTPPIVGYIVRFISQASILVYGGVMVVYGWEYFQLFPGETTAASGINMGWLKISIPVAGALLVINMFLNLMIKPDSDENEVLV